MNKINRDWDSPYGDKGSIDLNGNVCNRWPLYGIFIIIVINVNS